MKISLPQIVSTKLFTIFQFRAKDTCILALVPTSPLKSYYSIQKILLFFTYHILTPRIPQNFNDLEFVGVLVVRK